MKQDPDERQDESRCVMRRRRFLWAIGGAAAAGSGLLFSGRLALPRWRESVFVAKAGAYGGDLVGPILAGMRELGISEAELKGKRIMLKPNLVDTGEGVIHVNAHPMVVRATAEAFLRLGAGEVLVAEGTGLVRDALMVVEACGLADVLAEDKLRFVDLNYDEVYSVPNAGGYMGLETLTLPVALRRADWIVSVAKLKTHHWVGVTLAMKNFFGVMPGRVYGWPKNVLHYAGIGEAILDINVAVKPHFAIVDGIVGMEGDGPVNGTPKQVGALVMGRSLPAVDATCARIMGIDPHKVPYLAEAQRRLGPIRESQIEQRGENLGSLRTDFLLHDYIPAQRGLRLAPARG